MTDHTHILPPAETASRVVAALVRKIDLSHDEQAIALMVIHEAIHADRQAIYNHYADTATLIINEREG